MVSNVGDFGFFSCNNCAEWEGDCDSHSECQYDLVCGLNNCLASLGFNSDVNCCYNATLVDENFCRSDNPCNENEGNGDSAAECQNGLFCGSNDCPVSLGFDNEIDCCIIQLECFELGNYMSNDIDYIYIQSINSATDYQQEFGMSILDIQFSY